MPEIKNKYRIALDAMGGDFAPMNEIEGTLMALNNKVRDIDFEVILVGKSDMIESSLRKIGKSHHSISIVNADEIITMHDDPTAPLKTKKNSSISIGIGLIRENKAEAFVSAGNTGAVMSTGTVMLGRIPGVSRPTIGTFFPGKQNPVLILDVGANVDCKPNFLRDFAIMGDIYFKNILKVKSPKIGLLNIGEEETKGNELLLETYSLLKKSNINFIGNVEGGDVLQGIADVVICDGYTGNVLLKFAESVLTVLKTKFRDYAETGLVNKLKVGIFRPLLKEVLSDFDYQKYGGVPLLGVNGVVIIGHGKSSPLAIQNMIFKAAEQCESEINNKIGDALNVNNM
jgi:glycerol-3-phosphate acyltransferase PlsX